MPDIRTPWRAVAATFALNGVLLGSWASRIPAVMETHGLSEGRFGLLLLVMGVGALISFPLAGRLADRMGAVTVTHRLSWVYLLSLVLLALAPGPIWLAGAMLFFGMCHGSMDVTMNSWATEVEKHMGRSVMSSFHAMWSLGTGTGAAAGALATGLGLSVTTHFALAAIVFGAFFLWFAYIPWTSVTQPHDPDAPAFALPRGVLVLVGLMALASGAGEGAVADWSAVYLLKDIGATEARAALGFTVFSVVMVAMRLTVDRLVTWLGPVTVARASGLAAVAGLLLVILAPGLGVALAGFGLMGVGYAAVYPLAFSRAARDPDVPPGQAIASVATLGYSAILLAPPIIGFIAETASLRAAFTLLAGLSLLITLLAGVLRSE
ncbi:MFS transporter [Tropicimonas marinistellae]|uniref:MFS transporter n=1 Tax=Tropicimonas marinistellae TaxID=1739787 RepID=UPI00083686B7|nr:MFS transporter [Tropicimonas marinistellae]